MAETTSRVRLVFDGSERGVVAAAAKSAAAIRGLSNENTRVGKSFAAADRQATTFIGHLAATAANMSSVAAAGGVIGQAFAGALPILTALGVAGATVALGMDGIKKAAEGLKKPFDDLKKNISRTFEEELAAPFAKLAGVIPQLGDAFGDVAVSISGVIAQMVDFAASARGVEVLKGVLYGTSAFISGLGGELTKFLDGFLSAIASAEGEMRGFGQAFGSIFGSVGDVLLKLANDEMGTFNKAIAAGAASLRGLGHVIASVIDVAIQLGAAFGDSFGVLLDNLAVGIGKAAPGLVDLGSALGDLIRAAAPLLPVIGELAGQFAHALADGIRAVIPYVQQFAAWAQNNIGTIKAIGEGVLALALAVKALSIFTSVVNWANGAVGALKLFGASADGAATKSGGLLTKLGGFKTLGVAAVIAGVGLAIDQVNIAAAGGAEKLKGWEGDLHSIKLLLTGEWGNPFEAINKQLDETKRNIQTGESLFGKFLGAIKRGLAEKLPAINFDLNTGPAQGQLSEFMAGVSRNTPTVNINGRTEQAGQALAELVQRVRTDPNAIVQINGESMKAQDALKYVEGLINNSNPLVDINGNPTPAGEALLGFLQKAQGSTATANLDANPAKARETVGGWTRFTEGTTGMAKMDANPAQANQKLAGWKGSATATTGVPKLDADPRLADGKVRGWDGRARRTTGVSQLDADPRRADGKTAGWKGAGDRTVATANLEARTGRADGTLRGFLAYWTGKVISWSLRVLGGFSEGGPVPGLAGGGAIHGPGTGTSDTAGLFALSKGEHVLTAREVAAAGGHAAIFALRKQLANGRVPRMTARSSAASGGSVSSGGALSLPTPQVAVAVHIGSQEITDIVRTEIHTSNRATRRDVLAGAGASF